MKYLLALALFLSTVEVSHGRQYAGDNLYRPHCLLVPYPVRRNPFVDCHNRAYLLNTGPVQRARRPVITRPQARKEGFILIVVGLLSGAVLLRGISPYRR